MKKMTPKKLVLTRETLRNLTGDQVKLALGGGDTTILRCPPPPPTSDSVNVCCAEE
ncbi:MAG: hypothetical protein ACJ75H_21385 [Thermoanaerobaculia bacterium]